MTIRIIGLDLAKSVFQAHGVDAAGARVLVKRLHRKQMLPFFSKLPPCLIGVEACGTAHYWARTLAAFGHEVRLIPPSYVKAYLKRGKSDALDAEAICEAVQRPTMRFVPVKTVEQQGILMTHRARSLLVRQRTMVANALRAHLAEHGLVTNPGVANLAKLAEEALADKAALPSYARVALESLLRQIMALTDEIAELDKQLLNWHTQNKASRMLAAIPGLGGSLCCRRHRNRSRSVPLRPAVRRLAWPNPATAFDRRQNQAWRHLEAGRPIFASIARCRRHRCHSPHEGQDNAHGELDQKAA